MTPGPGIEPGPHWWEASALTTAPSLLPDKLRVFVSRISPPLGENLLSIQIHGIGEISEVAYATVVYLKNETSKSACTRLAMSETRLSPLAKQTISRLELLAALILSRLVDRVRAVLFPVIKVEESITGPTL